MKKTKAKPKKVKLRTILCRFNEQDSRQLDELLKHYGVKVGTVALTRAMYDISRLSKENQELNKQYQELEDQHFTQSGGVDKLRDAFLDLGVIVNDLGKGKKAKKIERRSRDQNDFNEDDPDQDDY